MERLNKIGIPCEKIELNLTRTEYFKPLKSKGDSIFIMAMKREHIYGEEESLTLLKNLINLCIYLVMVWKLPYTKMAIYMKNAGLRLTKNDGSANTVTEMQKWVLM